MTHPQRFVISHPDEAAFKTGGLRDYSTYRDLGVAEAIGDLAHAHVIRMIAPFRHELSVRHHHDVQFQMVYCLKGWFETEFEGVGRQRLVAGSSRRASATRSSAGRTTANCSRSFFRPNTRRSSMSDRAGRISVAGAY